MNPLQIAVLALSVLSIIVVIVFVADRNQLLSKRNLVAALLVITSIINIVSVFSSVKKEKDQQGK